MLALIAALLTASAIFDVSFAAEPDRCVHDGDTALFRAKTWSDLRHWRHAFPECDDGYLADGVSEFVTKALATRWGQLAALDTVIERDPPFEAFVLRHIDVTAGPERLDDIIENATNRCPAGQAALCSRLSKAAGVALREDAKERGIELLRQGARTRIPHAVMLRSSSGSRISGLAVESDDSGP